MFSLLGEKNMRKIDDVDEAKRWYLNAKCYCGVNPFFVRIMVRFTFSEELRCRSQRKFNAYHYHNSVEKLQFELSFKLNLISLVL